MTEKRKFPRIPVHFLLRFRATGGYDSDVKVGTEGRQATVYNISEGGLGILSDVPIPEETKLDLEFHLQRQNKPPISISAVGQVCYNIPLPDEKHHHTGIEFIMIKKKDRDLISSFVRVRF